MVAHGLCRNEGTSMRLTIAIILLGLAAACSNEPEIKLKNASVEQVAAEVKQSAAIGEMRFEPGQWRVETQMVDVVAEGMPPQVAQQMKASMGSLSSNVQCLTREQASRPSSEMFAGKQNGQCKYDTFELSGGKLKATMSCPNASGAKMAMTMDGSYTKTSYAVDSAMRIDSPTPGQSMTVKIKSTGTRTGECAGREGTQG
jgi:hypothetical protein